MFENNEIWWVTGAQLLYGGDAVVKVDGHSKEMVEGLNKIPGVFCPMPMGAFYTVSRLPVEDIDDFCRWCLEEFNYEGETVMVAPASGFYATKGLGKNEVRMAYVLKIEDLKRALLILEKALEAYNAR